MPALSTFTDMMQREIKVTENPQRIVSLVPSQTELLFDLGVGERVVGITNFCVHPKEKVKTITKIGGTKNFKFDKIRELKPDLIIGNKEENYKEGIKQLAAEFPVWMSDIENLEQALKMITEAGRLVGAKNRATEIKSKIEAGFSALTAQKTGTAAYFIWRKPYMAAGKNTFINDMLSKAGFVNVFEEEASRYPEITLEMLQTAKPDFVLLSSEPYPFSEKHFAEFKELLPDAKIAVVDGEMFSWYGSRLMHTPKYLKELVLDLNLKLK